MGQTADELAMQGFMQSVQFCSGAQCRDLRDVDVKNVVPHGYP